MIVRFDEVELDISLYNKKDIKKSRIDDVLPQFNFLYSKIHRKDIEKEYTALKDMFSFFEKNEIKSCIDYFAGCGFSGRCIEKYITRNFIANDMSEDCYRTLKNNFPNNQIKKLEINQSSKLIKEVDLSFVDFNNFTLKKSDNVLFLKKIIEKSKYTIITDSACYGFRMGNLLKYGYENEKEYYLALAKKLDSHLSKVIQFGSAALLLLNYLEMEFEEVEKIGKLVLFEWGYERGLF